MYILQQVHHRLRQRQERGPKTLSIWWSLCTIHLPAQWQSKGCIFENEYCRTIFARELDFLQWAICCHKCVGAISSWLIWLWAWLAMLALLKASHQIFQFFDTCSLWQTWDPHLTSQRILGWHTISLQLAHGMLLIRLQQIAVRHIVPILTFLARKTSIEFRVWDIEHVNHWDITWKVFFQCLKVLLEVFRLTAEFMSDAQAQSTRKSMHTFVCSWCSWADVHGASRNGGLCQFSSSDSF